MVKRFLFGLAASLVTAAPAMAQGSVDPQCPAGGFIAPGIPDATKAVQDACQKTIDLFQYMAPQLGVSLTGGNAMLGQGGTLGGLGHFQVELRGIVVNGSLPKVADEQPSTTGAVASNYATKTQILGLPAIDGEIGVFKGFPLGLTNIGGVDLLLNATYIPEFGDSTSDVQLKVPNGSLRIGYGARIGLLQESLLVPGVSLSYVKRDLPTVGLSAQTTTNNAGTANLNIDELDVKTTAWRLTASKSLILFGLAAGVGQDSYDQSAHIAASVNTVNGSGSTDVNVSQKLTRTTYFLDASMNLILFKLIGEVGQVSGGSIATFNQFDKAPDASRLFGSVGLRFGF